MWYKASDLVPDQRLAIESLLGRRLQADEGLSIQPSRILHEAPTVEERSRAYAEYLKDSDRIALRVKDVSDDELDELIDEACDRVRHPPS